MNNQLKELIEDYGAEFIQFDGEWESTWNHELGSELYRFVRELDDKVIVNSRVDVGRYHLDTLGEWDWKTYAGDFEERERMVDWVDHESEVFGKSQVPWQAWVTIDQAQWSYNATPRLLSADEIIVDLIKTIGDNGNYLINLGPRPDGTFHPKQIETIREVGKWVKKYSDAIYGTRGGPFTQEGEYTSTIKGSRIYLFVLDNKLEELNLCFEGIKVKSITSFSGEELYRKKSRDKQIISLPRKGNEGIRVLRIDFK